MPVSCNLHYFEDKTTQYINQCYSVLFWNSVSLLLFFFSLEVSLLWGGDRSFDFPNTNCVLFRSHEVEGRLYPHMVSNWERSLKQYFALNQEVINGNSLQTIAFSQAVHEKCARNQPTLYAYKPCLLILKAILKFLRGSLRKKSDLGW